MRHPRVCERARDIHTRTPRQRAALAPLAHRGELRRLLAAIAHAGHESARRWLRPGTITADLARRLAPGRVVGVDREERPLAEARALAANLGNATFASGNAYSLGWDDATFDVVHAHQLLQHLVDPVAALTEFRRVCRVGGLVAVRDADMATMTWYPIEPAIDEWSAIYHAVARLTVPSPMQGVVCLGGRRLRALRR